MCFLPLQGLLFAGLIGLAAPHFEDSDPARKHREKQVADLVVRFYSTFENRDLDALLKLVETPWYHDGKAVLSSREEVRSEFQVLFAKRRDVKAIKTPDVKAVLNYGSVRERTAPADRQLLDQVVQDQDYLVLVMLKPGAGVSGPVENVVVLVKAREGGVKIVGVKN